MKININVKSDKGKIKYYDIESISEFLSKIKGSIRELTALQWKHVNYDRLELKIEQASSYTSETGSYVKDTKNTHSERVVAFPSFLLSLFMQHEEDELLKKKALGNKWLYGNSSHAEDFVFTQKNGKMMYVSTPSKWFNKFVKANNLKEITFHGLRHTNTTVLINEGIDIVSISNSLGHAKVSTTMDYYAHHIESVERKMADTFDDILKSNNSKQGLRIVK